MTRQPFSTRPQPRGQSADAFNPRSELASDDLPRSVLFVCNENSIRSPMAEALLKKLARGRIFVGSAGLRVGRLDGFAVEVMREWHIALDGHSPHVISDNDVNKFALVISLTPEAQHWAVELTRFGDMAIEYWPMPDPSTSDGSRAQRLDAYRQLRDLLKLRIEKRFNFR